MAEDAAGVNYLTDCPSKPIVSHILYQIIEKLQIKVKLDHTCGTYCDPRIPQWNNEYV